MNNTVDVSDLVALYHGAFAGLAGELDRMGMIDGRRLADSLQLDGSASDQAKLALEALQRAIVQAVELREAQEQGPRGV